jgi:CRP-like cAMP-binding protein
MDILEKLKGYICEDLVDRQEYRTKEKIPPKEVCEEGIYIVSDGVVELCAKTKTSKRTLDILLPGDALRLSPNMSLMKNFLLFALTQVSVFYISMENFKKLGKKDPFLTLDIFSLILSKQAYLYEVMTTLHKRGTENRIKGFLSLLAKTVEERKTSLIVKKKQIAGITGLSYENVVRTMRNMKAIESRRVRLW